LDQTEGFLFGKVDLPFLFAAGMNGPPIMFMYRRLDTPKMVVRGTNAFLNLVQFRLIAYWYMGLIVAADLQLYAVSCAVGFVGVILGDMLSAKIDQQMFKHVLGGFMVLCCVLMFASGFGFVDKHGPER
jgi:uncharacterized membrane protein YfcA